MIYINYGLGFLWKNDQNFIEKKGFFLYKWTYFLFSLLKKIKRNWMKNNFMLSHKLFPNNSEKEIYLSKGPFPR
jgi:hypothetical protein